MMKLKCLLMILLFCLIGTQVYAYDRRPINQDEIEVKLEEEYGFNIILPEDEISYKGLLIVLESGLRKFPEGVIKEIVESYSKKGISTNIIVSKKDKISDVFTEYVLDDKEANIYINTIQNNMYNNACIASEEGFVHEIGHYVKDYLLSTDSYEDLKNEFAKLNEGYEYGTWKEGYDKVFVTKHSAMSLEDEIADLIWYTEVHPEVLRNVNDGDYAILHKKIEYLATVIELNFSSVDKEDRLWKEALPQKLDEWAKEAFLTLQEALIIPDEIEGIFNSNISKEDFYILTLNTIESKLGKEKYIEVFNLEMQENSIALDPIKGEIYFDNGVEHVIKPFEKNKRLYEALQIGLIGDEWVYGSKDYITRLEICKLFNYINNKLGMDISDYEVASFDDIWDVDDSEKPYIYYAHSEGLLRGYGISFKPYDYCTYQEAYLILMRFYEML